MYADYAQSIEPISVLRVGEVWLNRLKFPVKEGIFFVYVIIDDVDVEGELLFSFCIDIVMECGIRKNFSN